ncbi:MAG: PEGA domain-containing protein [Methanomicrobiales archaeon]|nr:PEGA domain-containing protein [Methanomicrobiales archaeon]
MKNKIYVSFIILAICMFCVTGHAHAVQNDNVFNGNPFNENRVVPSLAEVSVYDRNSDSSTLIEFAHGTFTQSLEMPAVGRSAYISPFCLFGISEGETVTINSQPAVDNSIMTPTTPENPRIEFNTAFPNQFQTGPVYVYPNTPVQLQVPDLHYDIVQIQWDYGDGTSSGRVPADKNKKISHTYTTPGMYKPVVTVLNPAMHLQLSSEDIDEHSVIVGDAPVITALPPSSPQTGSAYIVTYPKGVDVYFEGMYEGASDQMIKKLLVGRYDITLKREGFADWPGEVEILAGKTVMQVYYYDKYPVVTTDIFNEPENES